MLLTVATMSSLPQPAFERMRIYERTFGLTELRLYTTAFMSWMAFEFAWLALTVLRDQRERFAFASLMMGFVVLAALNGINPDALILQRNTSITG